MEDAIIQEKQNLHQVTVYFRNKSWRTKTTSTSTSIIKSFVSDYKEADIKLVALVNAFNSSGNIVLFQSTSSDINILMLFLLHQFKNKRVLIDNGTGNSRKIIDMSSTNLSQLQRQALASVHAFCGNDDYVLFSFWKAKKKIWNVLRKHKRFVQKSPDLGLFGSVIEEMKQDLEEFVCLIYGEKKCKCGQAANKNSSPQIQESENCRADYVTTILTQSGIPHLVLELCVKPVFKGKPIDDATRFSFIAYMDYK